MKLRFNFLCFWKIVLFLKSFVVLCFRFLNPCSIPPTSHHPSKNNYLLSQTLLQQICEMNMKHKKNCIEYLGEINTHIFAFFSIPTNSLKKYINKVKIFEKLSFSACSSTKPYHKSAIRILNFATLLAESIKYQ